MRGQFKGGFVFVAEEGAGFVAPVAADDVGVAEVGVGAEDGGGDFFFVGEQIVAAIHLSGGGANGVSGQGSSFTDRGDYERLSRRTCLALLLRRPMGVAGSDGMVNGSVTMKVEPWPMPALSTRTVPP